MSRDDDNDDTIDRDEILRRRAIFIASAVAGLSLTACKDTPPQPCLSIEYVDPNRTTGATTGTETGATGGAESSASTSDASTGTGEATVPRTADGGTEKLPDRPDGGPPMPCLSPPPQPCLKVAPPPPPQPCLTPKRQP